MGAYKGVDVMKKWEAIYDFFSSFNIPAYEENSVPTGSEAPAYPYIIYEMNQGGFDANEDNALSFTIVDKLDSFVPSYELMDTIAEVIGDGKVYELDNGYLKIRQGSPWAQNQREPNDNTVRRLYSIIMVTYYTSH